MINNWIKITANNIDKDKEVLIINDKNDYMIGYLSLSLCGRHYNAENEYELLQKVTYFQELPKHPMLR